MPPNVQKWLEDEGYDRPSSPCDAAAMNHAAAIVNVLLEFREAHMKITSQDRIIRDQATRIRELEVKLERYEPGTGDGG